MPGSFNFAALLGAGGLGGLLTQIVKWLRLRRSVLTAAAETSVDTAADVVRMAHEEAVRATSRADRAERAASEALRQVRNCEAHRVTDRKLIAVQADRISEMERTVRQLQAMVADLQAERTP